MLQAKQKQLNILERSVLVFNGLLALALLVSYLSPYINPVHFWPIPFFGMAYIPILFVNAVCLVFWLIRFRWLALISAVCILLGSGFLVRNIGFRKQSSEGNKASPQLLRVMTFNVYNFLDHADENKPTTISQVSDIIKEQQPDVINMQEYFVRNSDGGRTAQAIMEAMQAKHYWFKALNITPYDSTGLAIFSKYPIVKQELIPVPAGLEFEGMFTDIDRGGKIVRIYNVHLQSTNFSRTDNAYLAELSQTGKADVLKVKQIGGKLKLAFIERGQQVIALKQFLAKCPYPYVIMGDFNDTPLSYSVNYMSQGIKNAFREKGYGLGVTYFGEYPGFQLDYIMVSPQFDVTNYRIIRKRLSDHYPILSDLDLK